MTVASYFLPRSLPEALALLERHGPALLVMAGGTVVMPLVNDGISQPEAVMGLRLAGLDGLDGLEPGKTMVRIGAMATMTQLLGQDAIPMLAEAARNTASWAIRNMATVGGNLFTPPPGGDVAVALLALDARVVLAGRNGERVLPLADFYTGFLTNQLAADELLVALEVPAPAGSTAFIKFGRKHANTPAVVTVAVCLEWDGERVAGARIALGAVGPHPIRARGAERSLVGTRLAAGDIAAAAEAAGAECEPFTDAIATAWYRRRMTGLFVGRALEQAALGAGKAGR